MWDTIGFRTFDYAGPIRPAEVTNNNADAMRLVPLLVGLLLGLTGAIGLAAAVVVSVRARRRDLAVLRALGFTGRQVRNAVRVQAVTLMITVLAAGAPAGVVLGRLAWQSFAVRLGVGTEPTIPLPAVAVTIAVALAIAAVAAAIPARMATPSTPAASSARSDRT